MTPRGPIRRPPRNEQLPAPGAQPHAHLPPHHPHRQIPQQQKMDQRQQQPLRPRHHHLPRKPARQPHLVPLHEPRHPPHRIRRQPHIRIHEHHQLMRRQPPQNMAGMLLPRPPGRQRRRTRHPQPRIANPRQDLRRPIRARIVQHDQLQLHPRARQHRRHRRANIPLLIPRRNQHAHPRRPRSRLRRPKLPQVHQRHHQRQHRQPQRHPGQQNHSPPS